MRNGKVPEKLAQLVQLLLTKGVAGPVQTIPYFPYSTDHTVHPIQYKPYRTSHTVQTIPYFPYSTPLQNITEFSVPQGSCGISAVQVAQVAQVFRELFCFS